MSAFIDAGSDCCPKISRRFDMRRHAEVTLVRSRDNSRNHLGIEPLITTIRRIILALFELLGEQKIDLYELSALRDKPVKHPSDFLLPGDVVEGIAHEVARLFIGVHILAQGVDI